MKTVEVKGYYFPPRFNCPESDFQIKTYRQGNLTVDLKVPMVTAPMVRALSGYLKKNRMKHLARIPIDRIVDVLDHASRLWLDRDYAYRRLAIEAIPVITGLSPEAIEASIDVEMESSLSHDILRALRSEIKNPLYLDKFQYCEELGGFRRAFGPELIVSIFSENIPALPHLLFMRASLLKSACLGKVASGEPTFAALYLKTIEDIAPEMAGSMAALYWRGGDEEVEDAAFEQADAVVVFGALETCASLLKRIPRRTKTLVHGHKMGLGLIGKKNMNPAYAESLAEAVAYDHAMFDQKACLAPQVYFIEQGGKTSPKEFARILARHMAVMQEKMPRGILAAAESALIHQLRTRYEIRELKGEDVQILSSPVGTSWTVVCEKAQARMSPSALNRFVRLWAVEDVFEAINVLRPVGPFLQNAAVAIGDEREKEIINLLGELGVNRITSPGNMPAPSMMWRHDGIEPLASLLRWCDVEKKVTA